MIRSVYSGMSDEMSRDFPTLREAVHGIAVLEALLFSADRNG